MRVTDDMIDPQLRSAATKLRHMTRTRFGSTAAVREQAANPPADDLASTIVPEPNGFQVEEHWIPRPSGSDMRTLVKTPIKPKAGVAGILHLHGGGYHSGAPELDFHGSRFIEMGDCVVVSPAYRRSVEEPYPAALHDCYTALLWLKENAASLGVRDDQIVVTGESAGGGLTAATTLYARDQGEVNIAFQMPLCPMIDDRNNSHSAKDNDAPGWDETSNEVAWKLYLDARWGTDDVPPYAAPARATDYAGLPPTYTYVGSLDPFCSETENYIAQLRAAGIPADIDVVQGAFHGFELLDRAEVTKRAFQGLYTWFGHALEHHTAPQ